MKRLAVMTVGKTHSGKTTFAKALEERLEKSLVIDQDNHAEFINTFYRKLLAKNGPNTIKHSITRTILDYAVDQTDLHIILCNSNRGRDRLDLINELRNKGFTTVIVHFDIPDHILEDRVSTSQRTTIIFRNPTTFEEVLRRQQNDSKSGTVLTPTKDEADFLFSIKESNEMKAIAQKIVLLLNN